MSTDANTTTDRWAGVWLLETAIAVFVLLILAVVPLFTSSIAVNGLAADDIDGRRDALWQATASWINAVAGGGLSAFDIALPAVGTIVVTLLIWLAIPLGGSTPDVRRILQVRDLLSGLAFVSAGAVLGWVLAVSISCAWMALAPQAFSRVATLSADRSPLVIAWVILPAIFLIGGSCGRFLSGDPDNILRVARRRLDLSRDRRDRLARMTKRWAPQAGRRRWSWHVLVWPQLATGWVVAVLVTSAFTAPSSPWLFVLRAVLALLLAPSLCVPIILIWASLAAYLSRQRFASVVSGMLSLFLLVAIGSTVPRGAPIASWAYVTLLAGVTLQVGLLLWSYGYRGNPTANLTWGWAVDSVNRAERAVAQAIQAVSDRDAAAFSNLRPLTARQAARYLAVTRSELRKLTRAGTVTQRVIFGRSRYVMGDLDLLLHRQAQQSHDSSSAVLSVSP